MHLMCCRLYNQYMLLPFSPSLCTCILTDMDSATDTDSEEGHSGDAPYPTPMVLSRSSGSEQTDRRSNPKEVHVALEALKTVDTRLLVEVTQHISLNENLYKLARIPHTPTLSGERLAP